MGTISSAIHANWRPVPHLSPIKCCGAADVNLDDETTKHPDLSYYDRNVPPIPYGPDIEAYISSFPTMVLEVAFSQDARKLGSDCARWTGASGGCTNMAIAIAIQNGLTDTSVLESITVTVWTLRDFIANDKKTRKRECGFLRRIDGHSDEDLASPLASEYLFSIRVGKRGDIFTWRVGRTQETEVSPFK